MTCKHCGMEIAGPGGPSGYIHKTGKQTGLHRCGPEGGLPYGYDAAPESEPCSFACLGYQDRAWEAERNEP